MNYMTPKDVAVKLSIGKSTVYEWFYSGKIKGGFKINGALRFDPAEFNRWIKELQSKPTQ